MPLKVLDDAQDWRRHLLPFADPAPAALHCAQRGEPIRAQPIATGMGSQRHLGEFHPLGAE